MNAFEMVKNEPFWNSEKMKPFETWKKKEHFWNGEKDGLFWNDVKKMNPLKLGENEPF